MEKKIYVPVLMVAITVFILFTAFRKNESPVRQVWEYKLVQIARKTGVLDWTRYEDEGKQFNYSTTQKLNELGEQGWELVSTVPISNSWDDGYTNQPNGTSHSTPSYAGFTNQINYYLRRPK